MKNFTVHDLGLKKYGEVLQLQEELFNKNLSARQNNLPTENHLILCEHFPVYTLGKSGKQENILMKDGEMNAEFFRVTRGGDVTFHGIGQLVVYPIFDLDSFGIGVAEYIFRLEETVINLLKEYDINGFRIENAAGVWLNSNGHDKKICAIGAKVSRHITMHGIAINVNTDLTYFTKIIACGLEGKGTTSLQKELGKEIAMEEFKKIFLEKFTQVFSPL